MNSGASPSNELIEELRDYCEQLQNACEDAEELTAPLSPEQFNWRPDSHRWSIAECIAHLNVVDEIDIPLLTTAIDRGWTEGMTGRPPFRYGRLSRWMIQYFEPPSRFKMKAPKIYAPPRQPNLSKPDLMSKFVAVHKSIEELVCRSNGLNLERVKTKTPVFSWMEFSLGARFALITAHDRRHLWQAWQVRRHANFPD